jgi:C_GCAxxG_C_C family probable redox protein
MVKYIVKYCHCRNANRRAKMNKIQVAVSRFKEGANCAQALFSTYGPELGLDAGTALRIATPFGGGMGRLGETCGAVIGVFMIIGLKYGTVMFQDKGARNKAYDYAGEFVSKFRFRNGSITCKKLLGCDISTPAGMKFAKEQNLIETLCPKFIQDAAEIIEQMW